jgi:hypothetical protein
MMAEFRACGSDVNEKAGTEPGHFTSASRVDHEHPLVDPQVSHLRHVPLRTIV